MILEATALTLWAATMAEWKANVDTIEIRGGKPVKHVSEAWEFAIWVGMGWLAASAWTWVWEDHTMQGFYKFPALAWSAFAIVFRVRLNKKRSTEKKKLPWWYMGPMLGHRDHDTSSSYDYNWHVLAWWWSGTKFTDELERVYPEKLPGILAYTFECLVYLLSLVWIAAA